MVLEVATAADARGELGSGSNPLGQRAGSDERGESQAAEQCGHQLERHAILGGEDGRMTARAGAGMLTRLGHFVTAATGLSFGGGSGWRRGAESAGRASSK
jgi:hypothetical protein